MTLKESMGDYVNFGPIGTTAKDFYVSDQASTLKFTPQHTWIGTPNVYSPSYEEIMRQFGAMTSTAAAAPKYAWQTKVQANILFMTLNVPGVDPKDIELSVSNTGLVIATFKDEKMDNSIPHQIPLGCDLDHVYASHKFGVLTVAVPKIAESKRKISIAVE